MLQVLAVVQTSVTLVGVHDGVGEKTDLLSPDQANSALKVPRSSTRNQPVDGEGLLTGSFLLQPGRLCRLDLVYTFYMRGQVLHVSADCSAHADPKLHFCISYHDWHHVSVGSGGSVGGGLSV